MKCYHASCKECKELKAKELKMEQEAKHSCTMECLGQDCPGSRSEFKHAYPTTPHRCDESCIPWCPEWKGQKKPYGPGPVDTRTFPTGATRGVDDNKLDYEGFLSPFVLERFAQYMHECRLRNIPVGDTIRSSDNWQKGMTLPAYMKSMLRHVVDAWKYHRASSPTTTPEIDKRNEDALCAIIFNAQGYLQELLVARNAAYRPK